jgi:hypothetical protein
MTPLSHAKKAVANNPAKITAKEFYAMVLENPSVFEHWETPLEITDAIHLANSPITHLSPQLTFTGKNTDGWSAWFENCKQLKTATGVFKNPPCFYTCHIEKIENLVIQNATKNGLAASFYGCYALKIATGNYPGFVDFKRSGIERIENLHIENPYSDGEYADLRHCKNLHSLAGWNISKPLTIEWEKLEAEKNRIEKQKEAIKDWKEKTDPSPLPFL